MKGTTKLMKTIPVFFAFLIVTILFQVSYSLDFPGVEPGKAETKSEANGVISLSNHIILYCWNTEDRTLKPVSVTDSISRKTITLEKRELFCIELNDKRIIRSSEMKIAEGADCNAITLNAEPDASTLANRFPGYRFEVPLVSSENPDVKVIWRAELKDGANAIRQSIEIFPIQKEITIKRIQWIDLPALDTQLAGTVPGSPLVSGNFFFAYEHPNALQQIDGNGARSILDLNVTIPPGQSLAQSCAAGVVPEGQLRRGFLYYTERERAHPYRPFLHYNAWYDICWGDMKITEEQCLKVIETFGRELIHQRNVQLDSFVWDDGWDDPQTLWRPMAKNFPQGFGRMLNAARAYGSTLGFWLSPFGGYGKSAEDRYQYGREQGFEFNGGKFALAGSKYHERFLETCSNLIRNDGSNFFKFDGLTKDISETQAMLRLTQALRKIDPNLFISITTGTWPSPYWLWYGDSTWRGDDDMGFMGEGSKRERWITYRDGITYKNVVCQAPLYPLNALMNQGIAHAHYGYASELGTSREEFRREVQSFFACGTNLQELYISPDRMSPENWDDLSEAARWSQANADVLVDTHWIGGDPGKGEIYGWASWSEKKAILALRNPNAQTASIALDIGNAFELPPGADTKYRLKSPWKSGANKKLRFKSLWKSGANKPAIRIKAGAPKTFVMKPFEVCVYDAVPD